MLAPPWLIYTELLSSNDSRAHEAARELRRELLAGMLTHERKSGKKGTTSS
jgi:hypothetical protein